MSAAWFDPLFPLDSASLSPHGQPSRKHSSAQQQPAFFANTNAGALPSLDDTLGLHSSAGDDASWLSQQVLMAQLAQSLAPAVQQPFLDDAGLHDAMEHDPTAAIMQPINMHLPMQQMSMPMHLHAPLAPTGFDGHQWAPNAAPLVPDADAASEADGSSAAATSTPHSVLSPVQQLSEVTTPMTLAPKQEEEEEQQFAASAAPPSTTSTTTTLVKEESSSSSSARPRRRARYTAASSRATTAIRSSSTVSSVPTSPPALESASSRGHSDANSSAQSSEQEEDAEADDAADGEGHDDEDYEDHAASSSSKLSAKRKRTSSAAAAAAAAAASTASNSTTALLKAHTPSPPMKGLDKRERNKLSASQYRKRRKVYLDSLESKVGELDQTIARQSDTISKLGAENKALREQVSFLKKMMNTIKANTTASVQAMHGMIAVDPNAAAMQQQQAQAQGSVHYGARRGGVASSAGAFLFVLIACLCLLTPGLFGPQDGADAVVGRRGRTLLSFDGESDVATAAAAISLPDANVLAAHSVDVTYKPLLADLQLVDVSDAATEEQALWQQVSCHAADAKLAALCPSTLADANATADGESIAHGHGVPSLVSAWVTTDAAVAAGQSLASN